MNHLKRILLFLLGFGPLMSVLSQELPEFRYTIENMRVINSRFSELSIMPLNDTTYILVSDRGGKNKYNKWIGGVPYDMFYVNRKDWKDIYLPEGLNTKFSDGPATLISERALFVTQTNNRGQVDDKTGNFIYRLNITHAIWDEGEWHLEEIKGFKHKQHSYAHPAISNDGSRLFYTSDRPEGEGGKDLYVSYRTGNGWSEPENLGDKVNSARNESFPFYHSSGRLYFSSNRKGGMGGYDIYYTQRINGKWIEPQNIGAPINGKANEYSIFFDDKMERGFFSSNRIGGKGGEDVYSVYVDRIDKPDMQDDLTNITGSESKGSVKEVPVPEPVINLEAVEVSDNRDFILLGRSMKEEKLQNVYFSTGSSEIDIEGAAVMDRLVELLEQYEDPVIELHAHADATGAYEDNVILTEKRARSVMQYMIGKGVPMDRMNYKAYGESSLYIEQDADMLLNRRVEFRLKIYDHSAEKTESSGKWPGYATRDMIVLEPLKFYIQLAALGPNSMFSGYKLKEYGATVCYFQGGMYKYVLGPYSTLESARENLKLIRSDYRDAFIFKNY